MQVNMRKEARRPEKETYSLLWKDRHGLSQSIQVESIEISSSGIALSSPFELPTGCVVYIEGPVTKLSGYCSVRYCVPRESGFRIGLEFHPETRGTILAATNHEIDYYEYLQISPKAEFATIQRVYRFMAGRLHPDNPETGDPDRFLLLNRAYHVLSDPDLRAEYDATYQAINVKPNPIFEASEFVNGIEGETNRRLGILSMLYSRRRTNPEHPGVSMFEIERHMGFPREYLDFTTWYLKAKQYITMGDNAELTLTATGVDFVESNSTQIPILHKLLSSGPKTTTGPEPPRSRSGRPQGETLALEAGDTLEPAASSAPQKNPPRVDSPSKPHG